MMPDPLAADDTSSSTSTGQAVTPPQQPVLDQATRDRMLKGSEEFEKRFEAASKQRDEAYAKLPPVPTLKKIGPPPQHDIGGDAMLWLGFATALGGIAGAMTKRSSMNALAAFSGTLDGLQAGDQKRFDDNYKVWEAQARATEQNNKIEMDGYRNILDRNDLDEKQRANQLEMWATQNRNKFMMELARDAAQRGDFSLFTASLDSITAHADKGNDAMSRLIEAREKQSERMRELEYQRGTSVQAARARAEARQPEESDESLLSIAERKIDGDPTAGRYLTGANRSRFDELFSQLMRQRGLTSQDIIRNQQQYAGGMSGSRAVGTRVANLESIQRSLLATAPLALQASQQVSRVPVMDLARAQQFIQTQTGDPQLKAFVGYNIQLAELWARAQKPTGVLDVTLQQNALGYLSTAQSQGSYRAAVNTIVQGIQRELTAQRAQQAGEPLTGFDLGSSGQQAPGNGLGAVGRGGGAPAPSSAAPNGNGTRGPRAVWADNFVTNARDAGADDDQIRSYIRNIASQHGWSAERAEQYIRNNLNAGQ